jgi:thymidylate synthase (FAD)
MKVELQTDKSTENPDEAAIMAARGDYLSESLVGATIEDAMEGTEKTKEELIAGLLRSGHFGPFEHPKAYFFVEEISRVAMAQVTRHRHMSFDVQSQRYVDFSDKNTVIPPSFTDTKRKSVYYGNADRGDSMNFVDRLARHWEESVKHYDEALEEGIPKEDARFFLPQATPVNLTFSANPRSLMHFFDLRKNMKAQWEAREFATQVLEECEKWAPLTFDGYEQYINNNSLRAP